METTVESRTYWEGESWMEWSLPWYYLRFHLASAIPQKANLAGMTGLKPIKQTKPTQRVKLFSHPCASTSSYDTPCSPYRWSSGPSTEASFRSRNCELCTATYSMDRETTKKTVRDDSSHFLRTRWTSHPRKILSPTSYDGTCFRARISVQECDVSSSEIPMGEL
jgi:hypothetical protein